MTRSVSPTHPLMPEPRPRGLGRDEPIVVPEDALLEAFIELARSAIRNDREAEARRANMRVVRDGGRAA